MEIPRAYLERYNQLVNGVIETAGDALRELLEVAGVSDRDMAYEVLRMALSASDTAVSEVDRQFYQTMRKLMTGDAGQFDLETGLTWSDESIEAAFNRAYDESEDEDGNFSQSSFADAIVEMLRTILNQASKTHMVDYGEKDSLKPRFARVPSGAETCAWCYSLAGLGFHYMSRETASHSHDCCDCVIISSFDDTATVEGYDPEKYADMFRAAKYDLASGNVSDALQARIYDNSMRKQDYSVGWNGVLAVMRQKYGLK